MIYNIFGSRDSRDCDIMVFVDKIGTVAECKQQVDEYTALLQPNYAKKVNVNLAVLANGRIIDVFKGTPDEVNNSVLYTYKQHSNQPQECMVTASLPRDAGVKCLRAMRAILSFISRTSYREQVKAALQGTASDRYALLEKLSFKDITDLGTKNTDLTDFYKMAAFQMGQSLLLNNNQEVYTKYDIGTRYPELEPFLSRRPNVNVADLDIMKERWLGSFDPRAIPEYENLRK